MIFFKKFIVMLIMYLKSFCALFSEHHPAVRWKSRSAKSGGAPSQSKFSRLTKKQHGPVGGPPNHASRMPKATGGTATKGSHVFKPVAIDQVCCTLLM